MKPNSYLLNPDQIVRVGKTAFPLEYLHRGMLITGAPGSGKTRCVLLPLLDEILRETGNGARTKAAMILADPKNELAPFLREMLKQHGREGDLVVLQPGTAYYNPLSNPFLNPEEMVEKLISFGSNRNRNAHPPKGEDLYWSNAMRALLNVTVVLATALAPSGATLDFVRLNQTLRTISCFESRFAAETFLKAKKIVLPAVISQALTDYLNLPESQTRPCVMSSVSNLLYFWEQGLLGELVTPAPSRVEIDPITVIDEGKVLLVGCSSAAYGASITPLLLALKEHCFTALLSRDQLEVRQKRGWRLLNQERPVFFVADEFQAYLSPDASAGEVNALDRLRGFKAGFIAATQNLASLHSVFGNDSHAARLIALFANQVFLSNVCETTAKQAEFVLGGRFVDLQECQRTAPPLMPGRRRRCRDGRADLRSGFTGAMLSRLKTGEFWMRVADGRVVQEQPHKRASSLAQIRGLLIKQPSRCPMPFAGGRPLR